MEHIYGPARALVETYIIPNLYTVELWIGVLVVAISVVMSYVRYSNAPALDFNLAHHMLGSHVPSSKASIERIHASSELHAPAL